MFYFTIPHIYITLHYLPHSWDRKICTLWPNQTESSHGAVPKLAPKRKMTWWKYSKGKKCLKESDLKNVWPLFSEE